jgi:hypothetical protein
MVLIFGGIIDLLPHGRIWNHWLVTFSPIATYPYINYIKIVGPNMDSLLLHNLNLAFFLKQECAAIKSSI